MHEKQEQSTAPPGAGHEEKSPAGASASSALAAGETPAVPGTPHAAPVDKPPVAHSAVDDPNIWRERAENAERELVFRRAVEAVDWFDADDAFRELIARAERDESGNWVVKLPDTETRRWGDKENQRYPSPPAPLPQGERGEQRRAPDGAAPSARKLTPIEAVRELAARKPHWVRAKILAGTGAGSGDASGALGGNVSYAELLKPENRDRLLDYLNNHRREYQARLRHN